MSFGISAAIGVCLFILPGFIYLLAEAHQKEVPPTFAINRELFIALGLSLAFHAIIITAIQTCPWFPDIEFSELYQILSGSNGYTPNILFVASIPLFGLYLLVLYVMSYLLGLGFSSGRLWFRPIELLPTPQGPERYLTAGEGGIWCIVDIVTNSEKLFRGIYHSMSPKGTHCPAAAINLVLASRWSGKKTPIAENGDAAAAAPVREPGFRSINAYSSVDELRKMITIATENVQDKVLQRNMIFMLKHEGTIALILNDMNDDIPEFYIFWNDIKNINIRRIELDFNDWPSDKEIDDWELEYKALTSPKEE